MPSWRGLLAVRRDLGYNDNAARCAAFDFCRLKQRNFAGFWRGSTDSDQFYRCLLPSFCAGGRNSDCGQFRTGPLCSLCQDVIISICIGLDVLLFQGYRSSFGQSQCQKCPAHQEALGLSVFFCILIVAAVLLL